MADTSYGWLKDFDWSLRMVLSSDKMSGLRKPMVILKLESTRADGSAQESLIELDAEELETFLKTLKSAQKASLEVR